MENVKFEESWKEHSREHHRLKKRLKMLEKHYFNNQNLKKGYDGLIKRNMELQYQLRYEERVNNNLKQSIKRLMRTLKKQSELEGRINTLNSKTTHQHSVNKCWGGLSFPLKLPNIFSRI